MGSRISVIQHGDIYSIRFKYDPVLISLIKNVPGRRWDSTSKTWNIHRNHLGSLIKELENTPYADLLDIQSNESIGENATLDVTRIPDIDISDVNYQVKEGASPYSHQLDFMKYAIHRQSWINQYGFLLCDEQGAGKTSEVMNLAIYNREHFHFRHVLIICCVNTSKYNWQKDIAEHTRNKYGAYIIGARKTKRKPIKINYDAGSKAKLEDLVSLKQFGNPEGSTLPYFLIMNIESFRYKVGKTYPITDAIIDLINSGQLQMIAIDEVHLNMSSTSIQGKQVLRIKEKTGNNCMWIPITGTPIVNKPTDVFLPLKLVNGHNFSSFYTWCKHFCMYGGYNDHEIVGYRNIPELKDMLSRNMIRRLKKDILDLPDKIYYTEYVDNTAYQQRLYQDTKEEISSDAVSIFKSLNPLSLFLRLRQVNGSPELVDSSLEIDSSYISKNAKLKRLLELLEEIHRRHEKVIVFSNWVQPLRTLFRFVSRRYKTCCFVGTMSTEEREKHKHVFMTNPNYTVMLGTIAAMGTTHTFTAANNVIFYDEPWTYSDKMQAEDRTHRIGQDKSSVNIYTLLTRDTVDDRVHDIVYAKQGTSDYIVDDRLDLHKHPELFQYLLQ